MLPASLHVAADPHLRDRVEVNAARLPGGILSLIKAREGEIQLTSVGFDLPRLIPATDRNAPMGGHFVHDVLVVSIVWVVVWVVGWVVVWVWAWGWAWVWGWVWVWLWWWGWVWVWACLWLVLHRSDYLAYIHCDSKHSSSPISEEPTFANVPFEAEDGGALWPTILASCLHV